MQDLLRDLNDAQREAVTTEAAPLCVLAGAGSGKTRVLTRRIAHRVLTGAADAPHVLALTFTRKAAGELRSRLGSLGVRDDVVAGTFHAVAYAQLRRRWADRGERAPELLQRKVRLLAPILRGMGVPPTVQAMDVASEIEWAKARLVPPAQYAVEAEQAGRTPPLPPGRIAAIYERYEADKKKRGLVDFDDMLTLAAKAITTDDEFAATQRWRFRHLFVDEFQDVNPVQFQLLRGWLGERSDLCVVGDPNQAIYSWNGADPRLLDNFDRLFPGGQVVRLDDNYRSTPQVLAAASAVLEGAGRLRSHCPDGPPPTIRSYSTEKAEARGIAAQLRRRHGPTRPWSHMAVLVRTNAQALAFEEALRAAHVPFRFRGATRFLDLPEVVEAIAEMGRAAPGAPFAARIVDLEALARADEGTDERRQNIENLVRLAHDFATLDPSASFPAFKAWLAATMHGDEPSTGGDAVEIATFHRAKGLEWPIVFLAGLERGLVPIGRASSQEADDEERRLLYVAVTRAKDELHCSWAERRTFGESTVNRSPSPWLALIEDSFSASTGEAPSGNIRQLIDAERKRLREPRGGRSKGQGGRGAGATARGGRLGVRAPGLGADPDPDVFAALKVWRSQAARAANVPAYVIFHDTTLAAVAELRPTTRDALLDIPGLGPVKADRYGDALLQVVADHGRSA
ncbi:MAG TPA: ATP-dependent DNA helicase UvrD2 [Acidimicrobiales bacterium]